MMLLRKTLLMNPMRKLAALGAGLAAVSIIVASVAAASPAQAAAPSQFRGSFPVSGTDTTTCGFPIVFNLQVTLVGRVYFDNQGNPVSITVENNNVGTDSGNGVTLRESDHWVDFFDAVGFDRQVGLPAHIQGGGVVIRDAGVIVFAPDGSITVVHGPHPFIEGDPAAIAAYCAAFS